MTASSTVSIRAPVPFLRRLRLYLSMIRYGNAHNEDFAREHAEFFRAMTAYCGGWRGKRVLDVGCGKSFWLTLLLHSAGAEVTGIDAEVTDPQVHLRKYLHIARRNGIERALRTWCWRETFPLRCVSTASICAPWTPRPWIFPTTLSISWYRTRCSSIYPMFPAPWNPWRGC